MKPAKWIWKNIEFDKDCYVEFKDSFTLSAAKNEKVVLSLSCDSVYFATVNGKLVGFSQCADYPEYKMYDEIDITPFCKEQNDLVITVWHVGIECFTYKIADAGLIYTVTVNGKTIAKSDAHTQSRLMTEYKNGYLKNITKQQGLSFYYDNTVKKTEYSESKEIKKSATLFKRNIKGLTLKERLPIKIIKKKDSVIVDMGREVAGFIDLDFLSPNAQLVTVAYGEHIKDGEVRKYIDDRVFTVEFFAKKGRNEYINALRCIAGRYLEIFSDEPIEINYVGIRPVFYPVAIKDAEFKDELIKKIYDVSVNTLRLCMHEHYEDCPWREQSLYTCDSRNQMLCGYYAFEDKNKDYARHNLMLISKGLMENGLLTLCFPTDADITIPFFSLIFIVQVYEYVLFTGDKTILAEVKPTIDAIVHKFSSAVDKNGLIPVFPYPSWNFYEWTDGSDDNVYFKKTGNESYEKVYDLILNCAYVYAMKFYNEMYNANVPTENVKQAIKETFYDGKVFKLSTKNDNYSELGNAFAILSGLGDEKLADTIIKDEKMITASLSMRIFVYDALLSFGEKFKNYIIDDIKKRYKKMLDEGADTFWETEKGSEDFCKAGSLCHGWSAIPVVFISRILKK